MVKTQHVVEAKHVVSAQLLKFTFDGLLRDLIDGARAPDLVFVADHVTKSLVVNHPEKDVRLHLDALRTGVHVLGAVVVITCGLELPEEETHCL